MKRIRIIAIILSTNAQYGKGSEKPKDAVTSESDANKTKDEDEQDYIENGSKNGVSPADDGQEGDEEDATPVGPQEKKPRDLSNRPDHHNTMHSDIYGRRVSCCVGEEELKMYEG